MHIHMYFFCVRRCRRPVVAADVNFFENKKLVFWRVKNQKTFVTSFFRCIFDRLEKIEQSYQLISCLRKSNGRTKLRTFFGFFTRQKTSFFQKHSKSARQTHFFQKMTKLFYLMVDFFNKFY